MIKSIGISKEREEKAEITKAAKSPKITPDTPILRIISFLFAIYFLSIVISKVDIIEGFNR